jgi:hypothetical protein
MYAAIRRYDGIEPGAVGEFVRRVTADAGAGTTVVEEELDRWAAEGGFVPVISERPGFEAYYLVDAGNGGSCPSVSSASVLGPRSRLAAQQSGSGATSRTSSGGPQRCSRARSSRAAQRRRLRSPDRVRDQPPARLRGRLRTQRIW